MAGDDFSEFSNSKSFESVQFMDQPPPPSPETHFREPSMVLIRDSSNSSDCFVFPPINHENLQISSQFDPEETDPPSPSSSPSSSSLSSSSSFPPSDVNWVDASPLPPPTTVTPPACDSHVQKAGQVNGWFIIGLDVLYSRVVRLASSFRNYATCKGSIWSFARWAGVAALVVWLYRWAQRRKRQGGSRNRLMKQIIKEKDEKISQLLHQISQMNEVLVARHRVLSSKLAH